MFKTESFISRFLEYTKHYESPTSYFVWSAYTAISAVLRDHMPILLPSGGKIYPNIYTLLFSLKSSASRKGIPIKKSSELLENIRGTRVIKGRASMQGVTRILEQPIMTDTASTIVGASCLLCTEELVAFVVEDPATLGILTDWYDYHEVWEGTLVGWKGKLKKVCISFLAATNERYFRRIFTDEAVFGGLLARTFVIVERKKRHTDSLMKKRKDVLVTRSDLEKQLRTIASMKGGFEFTDLAADYYDKWYHEWDKKLARMDTMTGVEDRIHTGIVKIAAIKAAAEELKIIKLEHVQEAIEECTALLPNYRLLFANVSGAPVQQAMKTIMESLVEDGYRISKTQLLAKNWHILDLETVDKAVETLFSAGLVTVESKGNDVLYIMTDKAIQMLHDV